MISVTTVLVKTILVTTVLVKTILVATVLVKTILVATVLVKTILVATISSHPRHSAQVGWRLRRRIIEYRKHALRSSLPTEDEN